MSERIVAYRIDLERGVLRRVNLDDSGNWESKKNGIKVTHIEGGDGDVQDEPDGIQFLVEHDSQKQYPLPKTEPAPLSGTTPPFEFILMDLVYNDGKYPEVETLVVYDSRISGSYMVQVDSQGSPITLSKN